MRNQNSKKTKRGIWGRTAAVIGSAVLAATAIIAVPSPATAHRTDAPATATTDVVVEARIAYQRAPIADADMDNPEYLEGVTFELYTPADGAPGAATGLTCVIPAGALGCTITVPDTGRGGANEGAQYFVKMTDAGAFATPIHSLMTGTSSQPDMLRHYAGLTPPMVAGAVISAPAQGHGQLLNSGVVAASLVNPALERNCTAGGLSLAVQMDISGSVDNLQRAAYRAAFDDLVEQLEGTPVELSLSTFGSSSPVDGRASGPWSLDDPADVTALLADVEAFTQPVSGPTQQTNWDLALRTVANTPTVYDALLVLTDGAPNYISNAAGTGGQEVSGSAVTIAALEQAVFSANAVKAKGTRVMVIGIGNGTAGEVSRNLAAISGPAANSDYFQGTWETLSEDLRNALQPLVCDVAVTLEKFVVDADGENPTPADGWSFTAGVSEVTAGTATLVGDSPQLTGSGDNGIGEASWGLVFDEISATASLTLTEQAQAGFEIVSAAYTITHSDDTTTTGTGTAESLTIPEIAPTDRVEVVFVNGPVAPAAATFQVRKVVSGTGAALVPADTAFQVAYAVNGVPASEPLVILADGTPVSSPALTVGDEITLTELAPPAVSGITWGAAPALEPIVLTEESVVIDVANVATLVVTPPAPPAPAPPAPPAALPATGGDTSLVPLWLGAGGVLIAFGVLAVRAARRRAHAAQ